VVLHAGGDGRAAVGRPDPRAGRTSPRCSRIRGRWREGVASGLLAEAERAMREAGYVEAQLWTPEHAPARRFYEAEGWRHDGRRQWLADLGLPIVAYLKAL
jgi:GNAT superfamily N-acetyltransferase